MLIVVAMYSTYLPTSHRIDLPEGSGHCRKSQPYWLSCCDAYNDSLMLEKVMLPDKTKRSVGSCFTTYVRVQPAFPFISNPPFCSFPTCLSISCFHPAFPFFFNSPFCLFPSPPYNYGLYGTGSGDGKGLEQGSE
ncbi:hypothetical protein K435DRAFT_839033 [Dendrothele bispora CBS 962.96]|uniref:Uncharacterized protein n=1 Tax=Dendrothele bispora (strain CBS 962.96) TaxID=1314807 RepID=A0A4S8M308_DENBC|nr:hypothetical protein K435DRAFT_839033 [Dendrothele bispora CBS 962.96]